MCWFNNIPKNKESMEIPRSNNTRRIGGSN